MPKLGQFSKKIIMNNQYFKIVKFNTKSFNEFISVFIFMLVFMLVFIFVPRFKFSVSCAVKYLLKGGGRVAVMLGLNLIKYSQVNSPPPPFADLIWWNYEHWQKLSSDVEICNGSKNTGMIFAKFYFQLISLKYFFF